MSAAIDLQGQASAVAYLAAPRNRDLPELVRRWIATGEGANQDEIKSIEVGNWRERSGFDFRAAPSCECCQAALPEGHFPVRIVIAESAMWPEFDETFEMCRECSEEWVVAQERLEER